MRLIFMGTPDFAAQALKSLYEAGHEIALVVTQPDKPKGRSGKPAPSEVKALAVEYGLPVFQPERIREEEAVSRIESLRADIAVVAAFGQLLPERILTAPTYGCVNIHASLLPKYRGAAPIQQAIADGENVTGVTIMQMARGMDTGDILLQEQVAIDPEDTAGTLFDKLAEKGADLIVRALPLIADGKLTPVKQEEAQATKCGKITKEAGRINWSLPAETILNRIRAYTPWPGAFCEHGGQMMKIITAQAVPESSDTAERECSRQRDVSCRLADDGRAGHEGTQYTNGHAPGTVFRADKTGIYVSCGEGAVRICNLQPAGKKPMDAAGFLNGHKLSVGTLFQ